MLQVFEWVFGKRLTPAERLRKNQRALDKSQRELQREVTKLQTQAKNLETAIKKSVKAGELGTAKIQARDLIRTNRQVVKFLQMRTQLQAILLRIQSTRLTTTMAQSLGEALRLLGGLNKTTSFPQLSRIIQEFQRQNDVMEQKGEMMDDMMDDAMDVEGDEDEEADEVVNRIVDEMGVDMGTRLTGAPVGVQQEAVPEAVGADESDLQARLDSLRK